MKKKSHSKKKMAKSQNSYSDKFIRQFRRSKKTQLLSLVVVFVGLFGMYLAVVAIAPSNYGQNTSRIRNTEWRGTLRERVALRFGDALNRVRFIVEQNKTEPEWIKPTNLPEPPDETKLALPDPSIFGNVDIQSRVDISKLDEEERQEVEEQVAKQEEAEEAEEAEETQEEVVTQPPASQPSTPAQPSSQPSSQPTAQPTNNIEDLPLGDMCQYELEAEKS